MRRYGIALTLTALAAFVAAGHGHVAAATGARLTAITATDGAAPAVLIEASEPVAYRTTRPDPFTVLVDLRNVATSGYANGFTARPDSPVRSVAVETARDDEGHQVARVRVSLAEPISHRVRSQRNLIFVELSGDGGAVASTPASPARGSRRRAPAATASPMAAAPGPRAAAGEDQPSTATRPASSLVGNGRLAPSHVERAGTRRLYLDFPGVAAEAPAVTVVNQGPIERVRVALNSQKPMVTRVVVDLERPASHLVESVGDGREVKVTFREGSCGGPPVAVPVARLCRPRVQPDAAQPPADIVDLTAPAPVAAQPWKWSRPRCRPSRRRCWLQTPATPPRASAQVPGGKQYTGHPISLDFQGADLRAVLRTFAEISGLNVVIDPAVQGSVDVALRDVPVGSGARHHPARQQARVLGGRHDRPRRAADRAGRRGKAAAAAGRTAGAGGRTPGDDGHAELRDGRAGASAAAEERAHAARHASNSTRDRTRSSSPTCSRRSTGPPRSSRRSTGRSRRSRSKRASSSPTSRTAAKSARSSAWAARCRRGWATRRRWPSRTRSIGGGRTGAPRPTQRRAQRREPGRAPARPRRWAWPWARSTAPSTSTWR